MIWWRQWVLREFVGDPQTHTRRLLLLLRGMILFPCKSGKARARDMDEKSSVSSRWKGHEGARSTHKSHGLHHRHLALTPSPILQNLANLPPSPHNHQHTSSFHKGESSRALLQSFVNPYWVMWCRGFGLVPCLKLEVILLGFEFGHCNVLQVCTIGAFVSLWSWSGAIVRCSPMSFSFSLCLFLWGFVFKIGGSLGGCWVWAGWC